MDKVYKVKSKALKDVNKALDADDMVGDEQEINEFKRQGYTLRDARSLGMDEDGTYLHIKADEDFFDRNEKKIMVEGVEEAEGTQKEKVLKAIKEEEENAVAGMGAIFD